MATIKGLYFLSNKKNNKILASLMGRCFFPVLIYSLTKLQTVYVNCEPSDKCSNEDPVEQLLVRRPGEFVEREKCLT